MIILSEWWQIIMFILVILIALKAIIGIHWPWEKCDCCGKKWREIRRQQKQKNLEKEMNITLP